MNLLDLPLIILKAILSNKYKYQIIDYICFSLTCKSIFEKRDSLIVFNPRSIYANIDIDKEFYYKSFKNVLKRSIDIKYALHLNTARMIQEYGTIKHSHDYFIKYDGLINESINKLSLRVSDEKPMFDISYSNIEILQLIINGITEEADIDFTGCLPPSLQSIHLLSSPAKPFKQNSIISHCKKLLFSGTRFSQSLDTFSLPADLESLEIYPEGFDHSINSLPPQLKTLILSSEYKHPLNNLPHSLEYISFGKLKSMPNNLDSLSAMRNLTTLIRFPFQHLDKIPSTVKRLELCDESILPEVIQPGHIPKSITLFDFCNTQVKKIVPGAIHSGITDFYIKNYLADVLEPQVLSNSIQRLSLGMNFHPKLITGSIPNSVKSLTYGTSKKLNETDYSNSDNSNNNNYKIFPDSIIKMDLDVHLHNKAFLLSVLPINLKKLSICADARLTISIQDFPKTLTNLYLEPCLFLKSEANESESISLSTGNGFYEKDANKFENLPSNIKDIKMVGLETTYLRKVNDEYFIGIKHKLNGGFIHISNIYNYIKLKY